MTKLKSWNLLKFEFKNLFKSKKVKNANATEELNFLNLSAIIVFTKLR